MSVGESRHILKMTLPEYLAFEARSEVRHEYYRGEVFAMAGGTASHNQLKVNLTTIVNQQASPGGCRVFDSDMRVLVESSGLHTYPDLSVTCSRPRFATEQETALLNPQVIVEVLSPSTERYDRGKKFVFYRQIPSLKRYLLVVQDEPRIEVFTRQEDGLWAIGFASGLSEAVDLPEIHCVLRLSELYAGFDFASAERTESPFELNPERRPGDPRTESTDE